MQIASFSSHTARLARYDIAYVMASHSPYPIYQTHTFQADAGFVITRMSPLSKLLSEAPVPNFIFASIHWVSLYFSSLFRINQRSLHENLNRRWSINTTHPPARFLFHSLLSTTTSGKDCSVLRRPRHHTLIVLCLCNSDVVTW